MRGQCAGEHAHHGEIHYCVLDNPHRPPHQCDYGHTWVDR